MDFYTLIYFDLSFSFLFSSLFPDMHQISAIENPAVRRGDADDDREDLKSENSKDKWYEEVENISEPPDGGEAVDYHSDISDYEEIIRKKKKKVNINEILLSNPFINSRSFLLVLIFIPNILIFHSCI